MDDPDYITYDEAILVVQGLAAWLKRAPEGMALQYKEGERMVQIIRDPRRAGRILEVLMHTSGTA